MEERKNTEIHKAEDLVSIQDSLIKNSGQYKKYGFSQLQASQTALLIDEINRLKKEAKTSKGAICGCCGQKAKLYKRELTPNMCISLLYMLKFYRHSPDAVDFQYYTKEDFFGKDIVNDKSNKLLIDFDKLKFWDLITPMPTHPDKVVIKKGYYSLSENGIKFAQRELGIPKHCFVYNGEVDSHTTEFITIDDVLKASGFDYNEIIKIDE